MKKKVSLKWKIARYLLFFAAAMIGVVLLFQIGLLQPMYEANKISMIRQVSDEVTDALDSGDLNETIFRVSAENDLCVRVIGVNTGDMTAGNMGCPLYRMDSLELLGHIYEAQQNGNTYLYRGETRMAGRPGLDSVIYTRIVPADKGDTIVMVYGSISPVDAATATLKMQLWYISGIILVFMALLTMLMYRTIARPLTRINEAAKKLPEGRYEASADTGKYREAQELNETLSRAAEDIQKADRAKRDLIANVSHDLRTPLTMISGYGEMMRDLPGENNPENLQVIIDESQRLKMLVNDLLDLSRLQEHRIVLQPQVFDLAGLITQEMRKYDVYQVNDGFVLNWQEPGATMVSADMERIRQVFNNFMTNAINYSGRSRQIDIRLKRDSGMARVEVQDYGEGIAADQLPLVWDRYYKVDRAHVRSASGSGIGLAIVKEILDLHQVPYGVESEPDKGSTFWFALPLQDQDNN
ncbi:MAG: HAMP domain-containing histidine kinase [Solobacterium sp.]|nr:HAMP domain-containing histidine kinase [Solobacterium sp.]